MNLETYIVMINPFGNYWRILGEPSPNDRADVYPAFFYDDSDKAEEKAKEICLKMECETRVVRLITKTIWHPQPRQAEIQRVRDEVQKELLNPHQDYAYTEWRQDDQGQPTQKIGDYNAPN